MLYLNSMFANQVIFIWSDSITFIILLMYQIRWEFYM